jgi:hypothetical protein
MKLRTRLDVFSTALLSALGVTQLVACGGTAAVTGDHSAGAGTVGGANTGGANTGGASTGGAAMAGGPSGGAGNKYPCKNPKDTGMGLINCDDFSHREAPVTCASHVPRAEPVANPSANGCKSDADCTDKPLGWCGSSVAMGITLTSCSYGCVKDSDCASSQICECSDPVGRCVSAQCVSDTDCAPGFLCKRYDQSPGCTSYSYSCQSPADTCGSDLDCDAGRQEHCVFNADMGRFECTWRLCVSGRPFLVEGAQRLASVTARADWSELARLPRLTDLAEVSRARLAEQWSRVALMEHASIAAFARFSLQLMSLGAPASLIERATAAMVDETNHARACFAVASHYAGTALGPGRLVVERSLDESSLEEIVINTIREGCVGETLAAIEAREAAAHTSDPALRELLLRISEDETRHAELAYGFVKWALALGGPELEGAVQRELAALEAEVPPARSPLIEGDNDLLRHGIVPEAMRQVIREQALAEVVLPCSRALFRAGARTAITTGAKRDQRASSRVE